MKLVTSNLSPAVTVGREKHKIQHRMPIKTDFSSGFGKGRLIMISWFAANWGTIVVLLVVILIVGLVLRSMHKDKKAGKSSCGGNCGACGGCGGSCAKR